MHNHTYNDYHTLQPMLWDKDYEYYHPAMNGIVINCQQAVCNAVQINIPKVAIFFPF